MNPFLSLIIPVYNDSKGIVASLEKIEILFQEWKLPSYEVIVVNDCSRDNTVAIVEEFLKRKNNPSFCLIHNDRNRGKGFSVAHGLLKAKGRHRFFTDSDLSTPLKFLKPFVEELEKGTDVVIASRFSRGSRIVKERSLKIRFLSFCERLLIWTLSGLRFPDSQCGFKGFRGEVVAKIFGQQRVYRFCFDVEALFLAKKMGLTIKTMPVDWYHDADTRVRLRDNFIFVWDLLRIRWNWLKGVCKAI